MSNQLSSSQLSSSSKPSQRPTTREHSPLMSDDEVNILSDCEDVGAAPPPKRTALRGARGAVWCRTADGSVRSGDALLRATPWSELGPRVACAIF